MPSTREIRRRIRSAKNVSQITRAMEMVSASKMRRAQRNVLAARPYADRLQEIISDLTHRMLPAARVGTLLEPRAEVKRIALAIITPDRGLAGSLVSNALRRGLRFVIEQQQDGRKVDMFAIGKKGRDFMIRNRMSMIAELTGLGDVPTLQDILGISTNLIRGFREGIDIDGSGTIDPHERYDEVYVLYSEFVNTLVQRATIKRLIPVELSDAVEAREVDFTYEPSAEEVLYDLLPHYVEVQLYGALLESIASEHSARMVAMRSATDNAKELVRDLTLSYNKARQTNITKEVSEIATGAIALGG
ncbi:MAG: F0F1 ATP synthase subunit gamma [Chloroflexaceae bacterium]|nr:F0F1 ATP synthase subunit gamma [Chloroflexaceae bacterium]NJO06025.1 F0F1 ATP synthase subunit gamma [Chloroflexaceae bacterium]